MKELRDKTQETGRRFPTPQPTRAQAENFALYVASKLERGVTTDTLIGGDYNDEGWFARCPAVITCGIMSLIDKAEAELRHWFIIHEVIHTRSGHRTYRFFYDFEKGRFDMATIRKLDDEKKAEAAGAASTEPTKAELAAQKKAAKAAEKEAAKAAQGAEKAAKAAEPKERTTATLILQRSLGGIFIGELLLPNDTLKYLDIRKSLTGLLDSYQKVCGPTHHIVKIDTKRAELSADDKKELKAWGSFE